MKRTIVLFFTCLTSITLSAQQEVNHVIKVSLDDVNHILNGHIQTEYINHSGDTLYELYYHIWPNAFSSEKSAYAKQLREIGDKSFFYTKEEGRGNMKGLQFSINNETVGWEYYNGHPDIIRIPLKKKCLPGEKLLIKTPFSVKIPNENFHRLSHDGQAYFITQWYPKPAVYDEKGWHPMPYLNMGEFYSEFGSFKVDITLPKNYVVAASGLIDNPEEEAFLNDRIEAGKQGQWIDSLGFPPSSSEMKTLSFQQDNIHDFAWFADKRFNVTKDTVTLPYSGNIVDCYAYFTGANRWNWEKATNYLKRSIYYYSLWLGDYPYKRVSAVEGLTTGGGMEYPMITIIGSMGDAFSLETVIMHEVGHNWFYGILASDEREKPWLDEGMNSFYERRYTLTHYPDMTAADNMGLHAFGLQRVKHKDLDYLMTLLTLRRGTAKHCRMASCDFEPIEYFTHTYKKPAIAFEYLKESMGEKAFDVMMKEYYNNNAFTHPQEEDFEKTLSTYNSNAVEWFYNDLLGSSKKLDYKICGMCKSDTSYEIRLRNKGQIAGPVPISLYSGDSLINTKWYSGFRKKQKLSIPKSSADISKIVIDGEHNMPDFNRRNNSIKTKGIFKKSKPIKLSFLYSLENPDINYIHFTPIFGYNTTDKFMPGLMVYNSPVLLPAVDYVFAPLYSFPAKHISGMGEIGINKAFTRGILKRMRLSVSGRSFHYGNPYSSSEDKEYGPLRYIRSKAELSLLLRPGENNSTWYHRISFSSIYINKEELTYALPFVGDPSPYIENNKFFLYRGKYEWKNMDFQHNIGGNLSIEVLDYMKISTEAKWKLLYRKRKNRSFKARFFGGVFLGEASPQADARFRLSGTAPYQDYAFDGIYAGRASANGLWSRQMSLSDGGFKVFSVIGQNWDALFALNLEADLPIGVPLGGFLDIGTFKGSSSSILGGQFLSWDAGVKVSIINDIFDIYFPVFISENIRDVRTLSVDNDNFLSRIRFTLCLNKLNLFDYARDIDLIRIY